MFGSGYNPTANYGILPASTNLGFSNQFNPNRAYVPALNATDRTPGMVQMLNPQSQQVQQMPQTPPGNSGASPGSLQVPNLVPQQGQARAQTMQPGTGVDPQAQMQQISALLMLGNGLTQAAQPQFPMGAGAARPMPGMTGGHAGNSIQQILAQYGLANGLLGG